MPASFAFGQIVGFSLLDHSARPGAASASVLVPRAFNPPTLGLRPGAEKQLRSALLSAAGNGLFWTGRWHIRIVLFVKGGIGLLHYPFPRVV